MLFHVNINTRLTTPEGCKICKKPSEEATLMEPLRPLVPVIVTVLDENIAELDAC